MVTEHNRKIKQIITLTADDLLMEMMTTFLLTICIVSKTLRTAMLNVILVEILNNQWIILFLLNSFVSVTSGCGEIEKSELCKYSYSISHAFIICPHIFLMRGNFVQVSMNWIFRNNGLLFVSDRIWWRCYFIAVR